jgi:hypothetical protein
MELINALQTSIVQLGQQSNAPLDPVLRRLLSRHLDVHYEVSRVTCSREHSSSSRCFVYRGFVILVGLHFIESNWLQVYQWTLAVQLFIVGLL